LEGEIFAISIMDTFDISNEQIFFCIGESL